MNIESKAQSEVIGYISEKSLKQNLQYLPPNGRFEFECEYDMMYHPTIKNKVFVRSLVLEYLNHTMQNQTYKVYAFDAKSGKYLGEEKANAKFANELIVIKPIVC
jgi:hypothetical protein